MMMNNKDDRQQHSRKNNDDKQIDTKNQMELVDKNNHHRHK
jgi:hypothetical protein